MRMEEATRGHARNLCRVRDFSGDYGKLKIHVWGRGGTPGYVRSWRATANGLEGAAASATDTCLVLDELGVGEARNVAASVYTLANGVGRARAAGARRLVA